MDLDTALEFAGATRKSTLTTIRRNGRPQLSNVLHHVGEDGLIRISTRASRAKARNIGRDPWVALHVNGSSFFAYVVIEGEGSLSAVTTEPHDAVGDALVDLYRAMAGEHDDWEEYRSAMVAEERVVLTISPTRAYGAA